MVYEYDYWYAVVGDKEYEYLTLGLLFKMAAVVGDKALLPKMFDGSCKAAIDGFMNDPLS